MLDRRQRRGDDLNVQDRHEHAEAHQGETEPCTQARLSRVKGVTAHDAGFITVSPAIARALFSARMRMPSTSALRTVKASAVSGSPSASGSTAISAATTT